MGSFILFYFFMIISAPNLEEMEILNERVTMMLMADSLAVEFPLISRGAIGMVLFQIRWSEPVFDAFEIYEKAYRELEDETPVSPRFPATTAAGARATV